MRHLAGPAHNMSDNRTRYDLESPTSSSRAYTQINVLKVGHVALIETATRANYVGARQERLSRDVFSLTRREVEPLEQKAVVDPQRPTGVPVHAASCVQHSPTRGIGDRRHDDAD
jgi:hypothetical protein